MSGSGEPVIRVAIADDHKMLREALCALLAQEPDLQLVGEAATAAAAIELADTTQPEVLLLDVGLPDMNGAQACQRILARHPEMKVVALTGHADRRFVEEMVKAGARGYVLKAGPTHELVSAIRAVASGKTYLSPEVTGALMHGLAPRAGGAPPPASCLGPREREVLKLIAEGMRSNDIAERLHITVATVETHRRNIMRKLDLHSVADLTKYALREGLTSL